MGKGCHGSPSLFLSFTRATISFEFELIHSERAMRKEAEPQVAVSGRQIDNPCSSRVHVCPEEPGPESDSFALTVAAPLSCFGRGFSLAVGS